MEDLYRPHRKVARANAARDGWRFESDEFKDLSWRTTMLLGGLMRLCAAGLNVDRDLAANIAEWTTDWGAHCPWVEVAVSWKPEGVKRKSFR